MTEKKYPAKPHYLKMISRETMEKVNRLTEEGRGKLYSKKTLDEMREIDIRGAFKADSRWKDVSTLPMEPRARRNLHVFYYMDYTFRFNLKCYFRNRK